MKGPESSAAPADRDRESLPFNEQTQEGGRIYGEALLQAAEKAGSVDEALDQLRSFRDDVLGGDGRIASALASSAMSAEERDRLLAKALEGRALPVVLNFLRVLNRNDRLDLLGPALEQAGQILDKKRNRVRVSVRSAVPLDDGQRRALTDRLRVALKGAEPILSERIDPSLMGGLIIQAGDQLFDLSVRSRLSGLRRRLDEERMRELRRRRDLISDAD